MLGNYDDIVNERESTAPALRGEGRCDFDHTFTIAEQAATIARLSAPRPAPDTALDAVREALHPAHAEWCSALLSQCDCGHDVDVIHALRAALETDHD
jgi:hypothetical protein